MPFQNVETSTFTIPTFSTTTTHDYNLGRLENSNPAYGLALQATVTFGTASTAVLKLQASNDGVNFADVPGSSITLSASGSTIWDAGNPNYKFLRVSFAPSGGSISAVLVLNAVNLS
jgi:hypothetical protein